MKSKVKTFLLESALNKCYEACEKKASESLTNFNFSNGKLNLTTKGSFTFFETKIDVIEADTMCFTLKTSAALEFVRHITCEEIVIALDEKTKSCLISSVDKKSKMALQTSDEKFEDTINSELRSIFSLDNMDDFNSKLSHASKFCSNYIHDHPLTGIHIVIKNDDLEIKSTNGPAFYKSNIKVKSDEDFEFFIHKKSSSIIKNVLHNEIIQKMGVNQHYFYSETENSKLKIFISDGNSNSFPSEISGFLSKKSDCSIKVSSFELLKNLKYLHGVAGDSVVKITCKNDTVSMDATGVNFAAKESLMIESSSGAVEASYNIKHLIDCVDALQSSWVNIDFAVMQEDFYVCKLSQDQSVTLLCPDIS